MESGNSPFNREPNFFEKNRTASADKDREIYANGNKEKLFDVANNSERKVESEAKSDDNSIKLPAPVIPDSSQQVTVNPVVHSDVSLMSSTSPLYAKDSDIIEKEWIDQAKQIILDTADDPYLREQKIGDLQKDYIEKRYGRKINDPV